jgi:hypothetical protein
MSLNDLLIWMSARERGSWSVFRSAVEQFHVEADEIDENDENGNESTTSDLPSYQAVRFCLQRLGHAEFFTKPAGADWRIVPAALAVHARNGEWIGFLCGARSPELLNKLSLLHGAVSFQSQANACMPDRLLLMAADRDVLLQVAEDSGLAFQANAPASLLAALPPVDDPRSRFSVEPPTGPGWTIDRFSASRLAWQATTSRDMVRMSTALFRFRMKYQRFHFLRWRGKTFRVAVQVGKYAILRHQRIRAILQYDEQKQLLSLPVSCRPPLLVERALILCTGLLPLVVKGSGRIEYANVPPPIARFAAGLLRQETSIP